MTESCPTDSEAWPKPALGSAASLQLPRAAGAGGGAAHNRGSTSSGTSNAQHSVPAHWQASVETDPAVFWARWSHLGFNSLPSAFQSVHWLRDWYATLGSQPHVEPILVRVFDPSSSQDKLLIPLIRLQQAGVRILAPADLDVTDINSPLLQPGLNLSAHDAGALWKVLRRELAQHGDGA